MISYSNSTQSLYEQIEKCAKLSVTVLKGTDVKEYVDSLIILRDIILNADESNIKELPYGENLITTILGDKAMMQSVITKEPDQVSLLSTLVTYAECKQEGMKEHSREYMDKVTKIRLLIDAYYGETSQKFCGS